MGNEELLCEALIRLLEEDVGAIRGEVTFPEKDGSGPPVEARVRIGTRRFAIEHTLIEPFPQAIQAGKEFAELTSELEQRFNGKMPKPGTYEIIFPVHPTQGVHRREHEALRARMAVWIEEAAGELHAEQPDRLDRSRRPQGYHGSRSREFDGIAVTLRRRVHWSESGTHDGTLFLVRTVGDELEDLRLARIRTSLQRKLPKLLKCADEGDVTILVLEWSDIALTNQIVIARALKAALADEPAWPDHILLADTAIPGNWHFFHPVRGRAFSIDMEYIEIDRDLLAAADD
jgi:hypothetical protein